MPYIGLSVVTILLLSAVRWLLDIYLDILPLRAGYWDFGIPFVLSILVVSIGMWPRYESLTLKWVKASSSGYFFIVMFLALIIPLIISQNYMSKAAYDVIEVDSLNEIREYPKQKYFRVNDFELLQSDNVSYIETKVVGGRYFESDLKVYYYIATPFTAADNIWLGSYYYTSYDNRADEGVKNDYYNAFINRSLNQYMSQNTASISYFKKLKSLHDRSGYVQAIANIDKQSNLPPMVLIPESGVFADGLKRDVVRGFGSFFVGLILCLLLILAADIDNKIPKRSQKIVKRRSQKRDPVRNVTNDMIAVFRHNRKRPATAVLMLTCIGAFILTVFMGMDIMVPLSRQIDKAGGLTTSALQAGEYWRVFTSLFVHEGILHLAMSLGMLYAVGYMLEAILGSIRFIVAFFICGIFANILGASYLNINMAGTLSAIFGLFGIVITLIIYKVFDKKHRELYGGITAIILIIPMSSMFVVFISTPIYIVHYLMILSFGIVFGIAMVITQRQRLFSNARRHRV